MMDRSSSDDDDSFHSDNDGPTGGPGAPSDHLYYATTTSNEHADVAAYEVMDDDDDGGVDLDLDLAAGEDLDDKTDDELEKDDRFRSTSSTTGRNSFTLHYKLNVLQALKENNNNVSRTAKEFNVSRKNIQRWRKAEEEMAVLKKRKDFNTRKQRRLKYKSTGRYPQLERELLNWVRFERKGENSVTSSRLRDKASAIAKVRGIDLDTFKASQGWAVRFMNRSGLVQWRTTSIGQMVPEDAQTRAQEFLMKTKDLISGDIANALANMDEVPMYFDLPKSSTIDFKGLHTVKVKTTGHEKLRFSVVLTVLANGAKLKPMLIFKGLKNVPKEQFPKGTVYTLKF